MDKKKIDAFWSARTDIKDPRLATNYRKDGRLACDVALVEKFIVGKARLLDLGAGTCTLSQQFIDRAEKITVVEKFSSFLEQVPEHPKLHKICADVSDFFVDEKFDIILLFGVVNFLDEDEEERLYGACSSMLESGGHFIVKNQCGIEEDVIVDSFSDELKAHYHARYPSVSSQLLRLSKFFNVSVVDVYSSDINRWGNTHFYAFVCKHLA